MVVFSRNFEKGVFDLITCFMSESRTRDENKKIIDQFIHFINTDDVELGKTIIDPNVIFYAPISPEPLRGFEGYVNVLKMMKGGLPDIKWTPEEFII